MALKDGLGQLFSGGLTVLARLKWIFIIILVVVAFVAIALFLNRARRKKTQWTHKVKIRRVLQNGTMTPEITHNARRFPLEKGVEMFELDKPILGSYLIPQPGEYTGNNEFSIILDSNNRIWVNKGFKFNRDSQSLEVSAVHAGIDVEMSNMKSKWQEAHKVQKKVTTLELLKYGLATLGIIAVVIIAIVALQQWGDAWQAKKEVAAQETLAMEHISNAVESMETIVNTQQLQIVPMLKALYGTNDITSVIQKYQEEIPVENGVE